MDLYFYVVELTQWAKWLIIKRIGAAVYQWCGFESLWGEENKNTVGLNVETFI